MRGPAQPPTCMYDVVHSISFVKRSSSTPVAVCLIMGHNSSHVTLSTMHTVCAGGSENEGLLHV